MCPKITFTFTSSLGEAPPRNIVVLPVLFEGELKAVIELASFKTFSQNHLNFLDQLMDSIGVILNMISSIDENGRAAAGAETFQRRTGSASQGARRKSQAARSQKPRSGAGRESLEEKAEQLSLISKYKSEFLANMSHELRTPLNSLLILSKMLVREQRRQSDARAGQVCQHRLCFRQRSTGLDQRNSGSLQSGSWQNADRSQRIQLAEVQEYVEQTFRPVAEHKSLSFEIKMACEVCREHVHRHQSSASDSQKSAVQCLQVHRSRASVELKISVARQDQKFVSGHA